MPRGGPRINLKEGQLVVWGAEEFSGIGDESTLYLGGGGGILTCLKVQGHAII